MVVTDQERGTLLVAVEYFLGLAEIMPAHWIRPGVDTIDNHGGYMLIEPYHNRVVAGCRFDLTAADVVELCNEAV
jgi:hypothetical protein